eukprot:2886336-Amphidinium_carterae.1
MEVQISPEFAPLGGAIFTSLVVKNIATDRPPQPILHFIVQGLVFQPQAHTSCNKQDLVNDFISTPNVRAVNPLRQLCHALHCSFPEQLLSILDVDLPALRHACIQRTWIVRTKATVCWRKLKEVAGEDHIEATEGSNNTIVISSPLSGLGTTRLQSLLLDIRKEGSTYHADLVHKEPTPVVNEPRSIVADGVL